jgi:hypothetical protein
MWWWAPINFLVRAVQFKDLGLLVVDEEQRFGVNQKEKIKSLKTEVDVLTLSATPIPRTLYMALSGVREMSLITTPPALPSSHQNPPVPLRSGSHPQRHSPGVGPGWPGLLRGAPGGGH